MKSEATDALAKALSDAQAEMPNPEKNKSVDILTKTGRKISFKYADLGALKEVSKNALKKYELSIVNSLEPLGDKMYLKTEILHSSGQWINSLFPLTGSDDIKEFGGEITYAKRYNKAALLDLFADDDQDGDELISPSKKIPPTLSNDLPKSIHSPFPKSLVSADQIKRLFTIASKAYWSNEQLKMLISSYGYESTKEITREIYDEIVQRIQDGHA